MVNPLKWVTVKGWLWYQGERNTNRGYNRDKYQCTFPAMIAAWREEFSSHSYTDPLAPFGFVQLGIFVIFFLFRCLCFMSDVLMNRQMKIGYSFLVTFVTE